MISFRAAERLRAGHVWVYRSDIIREPQTEPGSLIEVRDERGRAMGTALYSTASQIAVRMISRDAVETSRLPELIRSRLDAAFEYRRSVVRDSDAFRICFSEADQLPGLVIDRYRDIVSFQALTQAFDQPALREAAIEWMRERLDPASIVERVDARIRELEQLPPHDGGVIWHRDCGTPRTGTEFTMNGLSFGYDAAAGQKTGAFLDQRENYAAAERWARGEALDVFCYQGGFALHLARACTAVTAVDVSRSALEVAEQNERRNTGKLKPREVEWIEGNAFDLLKDYSTAARRYDTIVLDPPAFAKSARNLATAIPGYKELNLRALKMLRRGGVLVTCSCSYHVSEADFVAMLASAAADAGRTIRLVEKHGASLDHPVIPTIPETGYLKCVICSVA